MRQGARITLVVFTVLFFQFAYASLAPKGVQLSYGEGSPAHLRGGRAALQWPWGVNWLPNFPWMLTGYWDLNAAYWSTDGDSQGRHKSLAVIGAAPVFRFIARRSYYGWLQPYLEASIGASYVTEVKLADRNLDEHFQFEDLLGFGAVLGQAQHWDVSLRYLHYSNGSIGRDNDGVDVKYLMSLGYWFG